jgi:hypothetical protein
MLYELRIWKAVEKPVLPRQTADKKNRRPPGQELNPTYFACEAASVTTQYVYFFYWLHPRFLFTCRIIKYDFLNFIRG